MAKRQIIFDTETTGMPATDGHRIIEIGAVELIDGVKTGRTFHHYVNPEGRLVDPDAFKVHNISDESLVGKPKFREIAQDFLAFIKGAELLAHNADFDVGFLNAELDRLNMPQIWSHCAGVSCTLKIAQSKYPKQRNNLDALCARLEIDTTARTYHGALLDAELLADAYLKMTADGDPFIDDEVSARAERAPVERLAAGAFSFAKVEVSEAAHAAHEAALDAMQKSAKTTPLWRADAAAKPSGMKM